jgi:Holliday junction resolvase
MDAKHSNELVNKMFEKMEELGWKIPKLAKEINIPKDRIYKWKNDGNIPKAEDQDAIKTWLNMEQTPSPQKSPDILVQNDKQLILIEVKTSSGKTLRIKSESKAEIELLNAFLEERERLISVIESQTEARINDLKQNNERLYNILSSNLNEIQKVQKVIFAMVRTDQEYEAAIASRGDKKKEVDLLHSLTKLNNKNLKVDATKDNAIVLSK